MKYILVDTMNLFFRMRHVVHPGADMSEKLGLSMHMMIASTNKVVRSQCIDHVVFCLEGGNNWRKDFYSPYKKQRADQRQRRTLAEVEEDELYFEVYNEFTTFLNERTNCSVISAKTAEADDVIARWIELHPNDEHVILSSDTDYYQLINEKVQQYNGVSKELITISGTFGDNGKQVIDKKTQLPKIIDDPRWLLFEKCMRGDKSDNVFSAFPGVRKKGTKNKIGLLEAFADIDKKGFSWNNMMLQRWSDHNDDEHKVLDDYNRNVTLIDLSEQPQEVIDIVDEAIITNLLEDVVTRHAVKNIGFYFLKFCGRHDLVKLSENSTEIISWMIKGYNGHIVEINGEEIGKDKSEISSTEQVLDTAKE